MKMQDEDRIRRRICANVKGSSVNGKLKKEKNELALTFKARKSLNCIKKKILVQQDFISER